MNSDFSDVSTLTHLMEILATNFSPFESKLQILLSVYSYKFGKMY